MGGESSVDSSQSRAQLPKQIKSQIMRNSKHNASHQLDNLNIQEMSGIESGILDIRGSYNQPSIKSTIQHATVHSPALMNRPQSKSPNQNSVSNILKSENLKVKSAARSKMMNKQYLVNALQKKN